MPETQAAQAQIPRPRVLQALAAIPTTDAWPALDPAEQDRRKAILWDIRLRVLEDGPRHATPSPDRGRQFIPFAALQGYDEMIEDVEQSFASEEPQIRFSNI